MMGPSKMYHNVNNYLLLLLSLVSLIGCIVDGLHSNDSRDHPPYDDSSDSLPTITPNNKTSHNHNGLPPIITPSVPEEGGSVDQYGADDVFSRRESQEVDGGLASSSSSSAPCCGEVTRYLATLAEDGRRQRQQTHQYHVHLAGLVQTAREALAQLERSAGQIAELRTVVSELRDEINRTKTDRGSAASGDSATRGGCTCPCTAEAKQRPTVTVNLDNKQKVIHLCSPMPIPNPSFEVRDRSWIPYSKGYDFWTGDAADGSMGIKVYDGGARQVLRFPPGTRSFVIAASSKSSGVPGADSINYSLSCDVKQSDKKWQYSRLVRFIPNSDWHERRLKITVPPKKSIVEAWCYVKFRRYPGGTAYFDNVRVWLTGPDTEASACK